MTTPCRLNYPLRGTAVARKVLLLAAASPFSITLIYAFRFPLFVLSLYARGSGKKLGLKASCQACSELVKIPRALVYNQCDNT